jgi:AcrR family transcriptional regulator
LSKAAVKSIEPRKTPVQARSTASMEAILQATIQVLLKEGKLKLTTTRVAHRAGVSVGTLYQYFPNKSALLQALLKAHLDGVALAVEQACEAAHGATLEKICEFICAAFLQAKFRNLDAGAALYGVSDDVEGKRLARSMQSRITKAMAIAFSSACDKTVNQPDVVASTLLGAMAGASRAILEKETSRVAITALQNELTVMARAYLLASAKDR